MMSRAAPAARVIGADNRCSMDCADYMGFRRICWAFSEGCEALKLHAGELGRYLCT
jgi:hypothetical protein